jgi:LacI family transcriptional regulator
LARYLAAACLRKQVRVPEEVAIVSIPNELMLCQHPSPSLTSIDISFEEVGYQAAALLERLMSGAKPPKAPIFIPPGELVPRQSTDSFAVSDPIVSRAMRFISEHGGESITVNDVAANAFVTRRTLERKFQSSLGRPISGEIQRLRIERVKRHLLESDVPIKTIALRLGFSDSKRLCEIFRRSEGTTPGKFRRERRGKA